MKCQSTYTIKPERMPCNKPDEITWFSHTVVRIFCPVDYIVLGTCGIQESDVKIKGTAANCVAIASAVMSRFRNQSVGIALPHFYRTVKARN